MSTRGFERWWLDAWPHRVYVRKAVPRFLRGCPEPFRGEVLEIGAGGGHTSRRILETFPQVELTATDVDTAAADRFVRLQQVFGQRLKFQQADVLHLPFDRESFDIAVALHMLHHLDDVPLALQQMLRVLRPGGLIGLTDDNPDFMRGPVRWLFPAASAVSRADIAHILAAEGCEVLAEQGDVHYFLWARKKYAV
ncbi:MAG: hypothetical protein COT71_02940 [Candidatus Andersenbacteria bacterium CG10_big_fil_rev_8_21_14_0_10_54_11]|uniref:Methyltransferase type 11 domain-containing protein n=1 Tax=Candidatus Andersenbacteria bacterium CG10_big_fil_rev_8_21_14_0_10_54_11 TaxID=1974485 RepID=A0A2M6WYZ2_9BACT|nr:MAG: hypothetical protein COT71_02940 [Candidatus Andersenbacteria bacterium CG10_big_fil_rev_8_21_14_0_10_54_11]